MAAHIFVFSPRFVFLLFGPYFICTFSVRLELTALVLRISSANYLPCVLIRNKQRYFESVTCLDLFDFGPLIYEVGSDFTMMFCSDLPPCC